MEGYIYIRKDGRGKFVSIFFVEENRYIFYGIELIFILVVK